MKHAGGCKEAFDLEEIISLHGKEVLNLAYRYLLDPHAAQDIFQEVFLRVWEKRDSFRGDCSMRTWIYRIAVNLIKDAKKSAWNRRVDIGIDPDIQSGSSVEQNVIEKEETKALYNAVMKLDEKYREVILLKYYHLFSDNEIADILKISHNAVRTRLSRARALLEKILGDEVII